jgi:plasmid stabilization system protein ParE
MTRLDIRPRARLDVVEIFDYLTARSPAAAIRFVDAVEEAYRRIKADPKLGMRLLRPGREHQDWRFRRIPGFECYLAYYLIEVDGTRVIRVLHGSRDLESALQSGKP